MKFVFAPMLALAAVLAASTVSSPAQTSTPQTQNPQAQHQDEKHGQVIFSRSTDENGNTTTTRGPAAPPMASAPIADDAERQAVAFTLYDLDVHLNPVMQHIAVRAQVTVRNDGKAPLKHVPLQISSSLNWERIRVNAHDASFQVATLNSDSDHTGQLHEAAVPLAEPLAPGASLELDVTYSGVIATSAQRLVALGTPDDLALHVNWDEIGEDFTGLRGFGNVVWYPVSSVPVVLGMSQEGSSVAWQPAGAAVVDSARLFAELGEHKLHMQGTHFSLRLTDEFSRGHAPTVALINGHSVPLTVINGSDEVQGVATAKLDDSILGFEAPSLFVAVRKPVEADHMKLWALPEDETAAHGWMSAGAMVAPFLESWLGTRPHAQLTVLDLPDPEDAPAETGTLLLAPIRQAADEQLEHALVHGLAHAWLRSGNPSSVQQPTWLDEGLAYFMDTLWLEKQSGRAKALESLEAGRQALALAEPSSPGESAGQPLAQAISPAYYRTKAAYIFWMLRELAGDNALAATLRAYNPAQDHGDAHTFEKLLEQNAHRDLSWLFSDWIDADKGLPDLTIDSVFPAAAQSGNTIVAVNLSNAGYASVEIPVTVRTAETTVTQRVFVPARSKAVQRILIQGTPTAVEANDGTVPETEASVHVSNLGASDQNPGAAGPQ
ncbi:MAG TPA: hypothetical protein VFB43_12660 [Terracidiphilus sp.]|nr:hypothetical protein [Terracidiphilus sp.]